MSVRLNKIWLILLLFALSVGATLGWYFTKTSFDSAISGAPPFGEAESEAPPLDRWQQLKLNWKRPDGPPRVGLQIGHLDNDQVPAELENLRGNTGAAAGGYSEVAVNAEIVNIIAEKLRAENVTVDILPTTVPPDYWADAFIAIHADGSTDPTTTGFKIAAPWRDLTGNASTLVTTLEESYAAATNLPKDPNITRNMRGYYAFSWWRFDHSVHPMTTSVIVETGFLTNRSDRQLIAETPEVPATALAEGILSYLEKQGLR